MRTLILTPTRELAAQVEESVCAYGKYLKLKSTVMFGGVGINPQIDALKRGVDIVVATSGRLLDHMQQKTIDVSQLEILVLDEADRMLDMGFIHDIKRVLAKLPPKRQKLLFSATFSDEIKALADGLLDSPALIEVARRNTTAETVDQKIYPVDRDRKRELLTHLIRQNNWFQVLVFTRTKHGANQLAEQLSATASARSPSTATRASRRARARSASSRTRRCKCWSRPILRRAVSISISCRTSSISICQNVLGDYVHRIGRTGRAGAEGEAVSLVCVDEHQLLRDIELLIERAIPREVVPGFEPDPNAKSNHGAGSAPRRSSDAPAHARHAAGHGANPRDKGANPRALLGGKPRMDGAPVRRDRVRSEERGR